MCRGRVAGFSYGGQIWSDGPSSKKKADVMQQERQNFIYGLYDEDELPVK